jgi:hypothetical protein
MEPVMMALNNLGLSDCCSLEFCCEKDALCKDFILQNHKPKVWNDDIMIRDAATTPACDLYVAVFHVSHSRRKAYRKDLQNHGALSSRT